jgi:hypothetical protein
VLFFLSKAANPANADKHHGLSAVDVAATDQIRNVLVSSGPGVRLIGEHEWFWLRDVVMSLILLRIAAPLAPCDPVLKQRNGVVNVAWAAGSPASLSAARFSAPPVTSILLQVFGPLPADTENNNEDGGDFADGTETASMELSADVTDVNVSGLTRGSVYAFKVCRAASFVC